jgi:DNA-binding CsgD family transcriptional regulator
VLKAAYPVVDKKMSMNSPDADTTGLRGPHEGGEPIDLADGDAGAAFAHSRFGSQAVLGLRAAFDRSAHPMLLFDDQRRWVTGNAAASDLLGVAVEEIPWRSMDDYTPPSERRRLEQQWEGFLTSGAAEGWYELYVPGRGAMSVEFSATANVLPARHLSLFLSPDRTITGQNGASQESTWQPVVAERSERLALTEREREVLTLVAAGLQTADMAERLFLSSETVKSHVQNAMGKLGSHTRAHAVAIGVVTGEITPVAI